MDYLLDKLNDAKDEFINAMSIVFPYEDFPLIGQMNFDTGESFYKKVVYFIHREVVTVL